MEKDGETVLLWNEQKIKQAIVNQHLRPSIDKKLLPCPEFGEVLLFLFDFFIFLFSLFFLIIFLVVGEVLVNKTRGQTNFH